jgi:hypothetical protein
MQRTLVSVATAGIAARLASASVRRRQIAQLRTALLMHKVQNHHRRQQVTVALERLRRNCAEFLRCRVRRRLTQVAARPAAQKPR